MKKSCWIVAWTLLICLCSLLFCGCEAKQESKPEPIPAERVSAAKPTEPVATEPEEIKELVIVESYLFRVQDDAAWYSRYIYLYPNSSFYETQGGMHEDRFVGTYSTDPQGRLSMEIAGKTCVFSRTEDALILENGSFMLNSEYGSVEVSAGAESALYSETILRDGIHVLDTSEYEVAFDEVLLDIDLSDMTFSMKCFDGNVVSGELSFQDDCLVCTYENGKMLFHIWDNANGYELTSARNTPGLGDIPGTSLMLCPQLQSSVFYRFQYAENQEQQIAADPEFVPLDSFKHLYEDVFRFTEPVFGADGQKDPNSYHFFIRHYPLAERWEFQLYTKPHVRGVIVSAEEKADGSIVFTQDGEPWYFHREENGLCFDGGSSLTVGNWFDVNGQNYSEMELPVGTVVSRIDQSYLYDALYILPGKTLEEAYAGIQIDTRNRWLRIQCNDGNVLQGPYTYGNEYTNSEIVLTCEIPDYGGVRTTEILLSPVGHSLQIGDQWMIHIGPGATDSYDIYYFTPAVGVLPSDTSES